MRELPALTLLVAVVMVTTVTEAISFTVDIFKTDFGSCLRLWGGGGGGGEEVKIRERTVFFFNRSERMLHHHHHHTDIMLASISQTQWTCKQTHKESAGRTGSKDVLTLSVVVLTLPVVTVGLLVLAGLPVLKHKHNDQKGLQGRVRYFLYHSAAFR